MMFRTFIGYLRALGWKVWITAALMTLAIFAFCGLELGLMIFAVALVALSYPIRLGMRLEAEKARRLGEAEQSDA